MKKKIKNIIKFFISLEKRVKIFWRLKSFNLVLSSSYNTTRTEEELVMAKEFNLYLNKKDENEKKIILEKLKNNLDENSLLEIDNFIKRKMYISENNLIEQKKFFTKQEFFEQKECSKESRINKKYLSKYKIAKYNPESFYGISGLRWLPEHIKVKLNGGIFLDIGAYDGDSSISFLNFLCPKKIYAFEPEINNFHKLQYNSEIAQNKIIPIKFGVSNYCGESKIINSDSGSKLNKNNDSGEIIKITTIDSFIRDSDISKVDLIKMDIEGEEMNALIGARETILRDLPILAISIYHNASDFFTIKTWLENLCPRYRFMIKKAHPFVLAHEVMLIAYCDE